MSATIDRMQVKQALENAGGSWLFDYWGDDTERHLEGVGAQIAEFADEYERRFGERPDPFLLLQTDLYKGKAFFQSDTFMVSVEMKILIWRILMGGEIVRVKFDYEIFKQPHFSVILRTLSDEEDPPYVGTGIWDFKVLRHFGA